MSDYSFEVKRAELASTRIIDLPQPMEIDLKDGDAVLSVDRFALTANNITYGVAGDMIGYWQFFPAADDWGRIPVWGIGTVLRSNSPEIAVGARYYGYFPMSSYLVVTPGHVSERGFTDAASHRAALPVVYNQYALMTTDNGFDPQFDDHQMVYRPLFTTSFVIDDFLDDNEFFGAEKVIISSASSKTSLGLAFLLHKNRSVRIVGLTSSSNIEFVEGLGIYDSVIAYEELESLDASVPSAFVDMAGNRRVLEHLHHHFKDNLLCSCGVGITHWDAREGRDPGTLPGAKPTMFFAPTQIQKRIKEWGPEKYQQQLTSAWDAFLEVVDAWITINHPAGPEAVQRTYAKVMAGAKPDQTYVIKL